MRNPTGEWWIDSNGTAMFADGDIGNMNHEMFVIDQLTRSALVYFNIDAPDEYAGTIDNYDREIRAALVEDGDLTEEEAEDADLEVLIAEQIKADFTNPEQMIAAIRVMFGRMDGRDYGLQWDGWKRVKGREVETWALTRQDLKTIGDGLWDAYGEECEGETFNIEVISTRTYYTEVPWEVLREDDPGALRMYE